MPEVDLATLAIEVKSKNATDQLIDLDGRLIDTTKFATEAAKSLGIAFGAASVISYLKRATAASMAFNKELYNVKSVGRELNLNKISSELLNLDSRLGSAADNAGALYFAYSAGVRGSERELVQFTGKIGKLSQSIVAGQIPTMDAVTSIMNAYNKSVNEAGEVTDFFQMVVRQGKTTGTALANSIGSIAGVAANAGVSLDDLGASIATLTTTMPTERAMTALSGLMTAFIKPTDDAKKAAAGFGIQLDAATLKSVGFAGMMKLIHDRVGDNTAAIARIIPNVEGMRAAVALAGGQYKTFADNTVLFANKAGEANAAFAAQADNLDKQISSLPATFNKINIQVGETVKSFLTLGGTLTPVIASFNKMGENGQQLAAGIAILTTGAILYKSAVGAVNTVRTIKLALQAKSIQSEAAQTAATTAGTAAIEAQNVALTKNIALAKAREATGIGGGIVGGAVSGAAGGAVSAVSGAVAASFGAKFLGFIKTGLTKVAAPIAIATAVGSMIGIPLVKALGNWLANGDAGLKRGEAADKKTAELNKRIAEKRAAQTQKENAQKERSSAVVQLNDARNARAFDKASLFEKKGLLQMQLRSLYNQQSQNLNDPKKLLEIENQIYAKEDKLAEVKKQMADRKKLRVQQIKDAEEKQFSRENEIFNMELQNMSRYDRQNAMQSRFNELRRRFSGASDVNQMKRILGSAQSIQQMMQDSVRAPQYVRGFQSASNAVMAGSNAAASAESRSYFVTPISQFSQKVDDNLKALKEMQNQMIIELRKLVNKPQIAVN